MMALKVNPLAQAVSTGPQYTTDNLQIDGNYQLKLVVSDGCSTDQAVLCFTVQCGCGPTANAGATSTVWTNTPAIFNSGQTSSGSNLVDGNGPSFTLDGSLSYDFDTASGLTYDWSFQEWVQILDGGNQRVWNPTTSAAGTGRQAGLTYKTDCQTTKIATGSPTIKSVCQFKGIPSAAAGSSQVGPITSADISPKPGTISSTPSGFPRKCPAYVSTEYEFATPTTQMRATVERSLINTTAITQYTQRTTQILPGDVVATTYCEIAITQIATGQTDARFNPLASFTVSSLTACKGMWTFQLEVTDGCGKATSSVDTIKVTVRCNEPPIAVLCCNNTQMWNTQFQRFQQVRLDGRGSDDPDVNGGSLTYSWSFLNSPSGFCGASGYNHQVCEEAYCTNANGFTQISTTGSPTFRQVFGGSAGVSCGPTVYPIIRDRTIAINQPCSEPNPNGVPASGGQRYCQYQAIAPTGYHVGNSAYFTPSTRGSYQIQLQVSDGCSTTTDTVFIVAECPVLSASAAAASTAGGASTYQLVKPGGASATIDLSGIADYSGDPSTLSFSWSSKGGSPSQPLPPATFSTGNAKLTTAAFSAAGVYYVQFSVTDKCQTVIAAVQPITVSCNPAPTGATMTKINGNPGVNMVLFSGTSFESVRVQASAVDNDQLTYAFSLIDAGISGVSTGSQFEFTAIANGQGNTPYNVQVTASDGCSVSAPGTIAIRAECKGPLIARATLGGGSGGSSATVVEYNPKASNPNVFPTVTVDSTQTVWPYSDVPGNTKTYFWTAAVSGGGSQSVTFSGQSSSMITIVPTIAASYTVTLSASDGCQNQSSTVAFEARCSMVAQAVASATPGTSVTWDSFKTATGGGFPQVTLDGSASTGLAGVDLSYAWNVASGNTVAATLGNTIGSLSSFTPTKGATYGFTLNVRNGPCPASAAATISITAVCNELVAVLRQGTDSQASVALDSRWDGSKFPTVELNGMGLTYRQNSGRTVGDAQSGNLRSLKYTWNVIQSPICSCYGQENGPNVVTSNSVDSARQTQRVANSNASLVITDETWTKTVSTTTIATTSTLANHHYLLPHTCLKPDCAGTYKVLLTIDDGCLTKTATATINVVCGTKPIVQIDSSASGTQTLQGTKFTRVNLVALVTGSDFSTEVLSYQWKLVTIPVGSRLKTGGSDSITNGQMPMASFVPDRAGVYAFQFSADDGCNDVVVASSSLTVRCDSTLAISSAVATNLELRWTGNYRQANATANITGITNFDNNKFTMTGRVDGKCNTLSTRWRLLARDCIDAYNVGATPPPVAASGAVCKPCALTCKWNVTSSPCPDPAVNPNYVNYRLDELAGSSTANPDCKDKIQFLPQYPGTYTLQFSVRDCCGNSKASMRVVAKCHTGLKANVGTATINSIFTCMGDGNLDWQTHALQGAPDVSNASPDPSSVAACPVVQTKPNCATMPTGCCQAAATAATPDGPCSAAELAAVSAASATAAGPTATVMGLMASSPKCGSCLVGCASQTGAGQLACVKACGPGTPATTGATTSKCCGGFQCPMCPMCAQCPQCPGYGAPSTAGAADYKLPYHNAAFTQRAGALVMANDPLAKSSALTGAAPTRPPSLLWCRMCIAAVP
jgi:hypothetical protein